MTKKTSRVTTGYGVAAFLGLLALLFSISNSAGAQTTYPELKYEQIGEMRKWRVAPDYPNPPPLRVRLNGSTVLEYSISKGYETDFRSGPQMLDIIVKQLGPNNLNLAWLVHDINYEGYVKDRKVADRLLFAMLLDAGVSTIRAAAVYAGVRLFGKSHWCSGATPSGPCAADPLIHFQEVQTPLYAKRGMLATIEALPSFELQPMRLTLLTQQDKDDVHTEIEKLFPNDADAVKKAFDEDRP